MSITGFIDYNDMECYFFYFSTSGDLELDNLLLEIDHLVNSLPFVLSNLNLDSATDIQSLRKENIQIKQ